MGLHFKKLGRKMNIGGGNLKENGSGKSKKLAKRQAANRMLLTLKSMPVERDNEQSLATIDEDDLAQGIARKVAAANKSTDPAADPSFFKFHRDLKTSRGPHLAGLNDQELRPRERPRIQ